MAGSQEKQRLQDSPTDEHSAINQRLKDDGLDPQCDDSQKLLHVWKLYKKTESDLQKAVESEEKLRVDQTEEMQEVENYVEHIRNLSDERETLIQELETENEQLRTEVDKLKQDGADTALIKETAEMLTQQGLEEIAHASSSEQIAFLLVERARLLDELEMEQTQNEGQNAEDLKQILERERADFEEELAQQRERAAEVLNSLKMEHEEEINALIDENAKLDEELTTLKNTIKDLTSEVDKLSDDLTNEENEKKKVQTALTALEKEVKEKEKESPRLEVVRTEVVRAPSPGLGRTTTDVALRKVIEEKTKIEGELVSLTSKVRSLENELSAKSDKMSKMSDDLEKGQMIQQQLQMKNKNLRKEAEEMEQQLDEAELSVEKMTKENEEFSKKMETLQAEVKTLKAESHKASTLQDIVDILNNEKSELNSQLETLRQDLRAAMYKNEELTNQNRQHIQKEEELTNHIESLMMDIEAVKDENKKLSNERDLLTETQKEQSELLKSWQEELYSLRSEKVSLENDVDVLDKEKNDLSNKLEKIEDNLNKLKKENQDIAKQEIILNHMREQNQKLTSQVSDLQAELNEVKIREGTLIQTQKALDGSKEESDKRYKLELEDLKTKLQLSLEELQKVKTSLEKERNDKNILQEKNFQLEKTVEELSQVRKQLEEEKKLKSDLEMKIHELQLSLAERSLVADGFEGERKQRMELEKKMSELNQVDSEAASLREQVASQSEQIASLNEQVASLKGKLDEERRERASLEDTVQDLEQIVEDQKVDQENLQQSMNNKVKSLEGRVVALQDDLFAAQDEMQAVQEKFEKDEIDSKTASSSCPVINEPQTITSADPPEQQITSSKQQTLDSKPKESVISSKQQTLDSKPTESVISSKQQVLDSKPTDSDSRQLEAKLRESLIALQASNTRIHELEEELLSSSLKAEQTHTIQEDSEKRLEKSEDDLKQVRGDLKQVKNELNKAQSALDVTKAELDDMHRNAELMNSAQDSLELQLELTKTSLQYDGDERQEHMDRIKTLEKLSRQLELDNREMAKKLSETMAEHKNLVIQLQTEKKRNLDKQNFNRTNIAQLEDELEATNKQIQHLREEIHCLQTQVFKLEANEVGQQAKHESAITRLEMELKEAKTFHRQEVNTLKDKLHASNTEANDCRNKHSEAEQELLEKKGELQRLKLTVERLESQLQTETKLRTDYENRNISLDHEMTKVWSQIRILMEKNANLENTKRSLEDQLDRRSVSSRQAEHVFSETAAYQDSTNKFLRNRTEAAEQTVSGITLQPLITKAAKLQRELQEVTMKMHQSEESLINMADSGVELQEKKDQIVQLRNQLEGEKLQRTLLDQTVAELKHQVSLLKHRESKLADENQSLQHTILDLESRLNDLEDQKDQAYDMHHQLSEVGQQSLLEQIARLQKEVKDLQFELITNNEKHSFDEQRYMDRKHRTKEKLLRAREFYSVERSRLKEHMSRVDEDLELTRATLRKELEWKDKMDMNYKHLLQEKRGLITQLTDLEEDLRDRSRALAMLQIRSKFLEEENSRLQDRIDSISQDKQYLDRTLKELQRERNRESYSLQSADVNVASFAVSTSGLGNSMKSSWEEENLRQGVLSTETNDYHSRLYNPQTINLRHSLESGSNHSMDEEFDA
ncbi:myosin-2 heavy chain-like isoform X2 [Gigantopelta aegis]|uniref:myosin-2 heavy chain-like isoform X2 n=1 Tax=Gigantopelta aegis TaxID=1735272 RepID=UPI001B88E354|nr:myosin-2 heavy chain-like isoform X2 [Gigantopelta aegis]